MLGEIKERLTKDELEVKTRKLDEEYGQKYFKHKNGDVYFVIGGTTININGVSYWGLLYVPEGRVNVFHTRPLFEFLDGRFTFVE